MASLLVGLEADANDTRCRSRCTGSSFGCSAIHKHPRPGYWLETPAAIAAAPATSGSQSGVPDSYRVASTEQPDPNDARSSDLMNRLLEIPPRWCMSNPHRWVVINLEYFSLSKQYGK